MLNYLDKGTRKQIYTKKFLSLSEIDAPLLKSYLFESALIDEEAYIAKSIN
ncbi:hypothetical protein [uncultured Arcticibacterium sp.]|uniref:hypothetical protein n=1 Tax=uncultured Arcticibacterium sp. TaxID=2173042 RepID=UPI0030F88535